MRPTPPTRTRWTRWLRRWMCSRRCSPRCSSTCPRSDRASYSQPTHQTNHTQPPTTMEYLAIASALVALVEQLIPKIKELAQSGDVTPEEQQALLARVAAIRVALASGF